MAAFIWRENAREGVYGATTMVAALVTFVLGAVAMLGDMRVAAGAGVVTVGLLAYKTTLHGFLARITAKELRSALLLAAMTFIALPLLPDHAIDPVGGAEPAPAVADDHPHRRRLLRRLHRGEARWPLARAGAGGGAGRPRLVNRGDADAGAARQGQCGAIGLLSGSILPPVA